MIIVGLTGGIASGKSTVAGMLAAKGALVLDADRIAREVVEPGRPAWQEIVAWLGEEYLAPDRSLDRRRIGDLVFRDAGARSRLNSIVHPRVGEELLARAAQAGRDRPGAGMLVYDVPLLIEAGMHRLVDVVLLVYVPRETQLERLRARDGLSREEAEARVAAQMPLDAKRSYAHHVIDNSGTVAETALQVNRAWEKLTAGAKE